MSSWTLLTTNSHTTVTGGTWDDPVPHLYIRIDSGLAVTVNLPTREQDAARLLDNLIDQAESMLATIPGHQHRTNETTNRK